jgi:hypothetical protein
MEAGSSLPCSLDPTLIDISSDSTRRFNAYCQRVRFEPQFKVVKITDEIIYHQMQDTEAKFK